MLKISISENGTKRQLILEGKLIEPWTNELKIVGQQAVVASDHRDLIIDLRSVTAISADGERVLLALMDQGAKFRACGVFMRQVLKNLSRRLRDARETSEKEKT
jgi:anti-anti-sigma regulatory factor